MAEGTALIPVVKGIGTAVGGASVAIGAAGLLVGGSLAGVAIGTFDQIAHPDGLIHHADGSISYTTSAKIGMAIEDGWKNTTNLIGSLNPFASKVEATTSPSSTTATFKAISLPAEAYKGLSDVEIKVVNETIEYLNTQEARANLKKAGIEDPQDYLMQHVFAMGTTSSSSDATSGNSSGTGGSNGKPPPNPLSVPFAIMTIIAGVSIGLSFWSHSTANSALELSRKTLDVNEKVQGLNVNIMKVLEKTDTHKQMNGALGSLLFARGLEKSKPESFNKLKTAVNKILAEGKIPLSEGKITLEQALKITKANWLTILEVFIQERETLKADDKYNVYSSFDDKLVSPLKEYVNVLDGLKKEGTPVANTSDAEIIKKFGVTQEEINEARK